MTNVVAMPAEPKKLTFREIVSQDLTAEQAEEAARAERNALTGRINDIRRKLSGFDYGTNEQVIARKSKIAAIEAILAAE